MSQCRYYIIPGLAIFKFTKLGIFRKYLHDSGVGDSEIEDISNSYKNDKDFIDNNRSARIVDKKWLKLRNYKKLLDIIDNF